MPLVDQFLLRKITTYSTRTNFLLQTLPFITYSFSWEPGTCNKLKRLTNIVSKTGSTSVFWILQRAKVNNNYIKILLKLLLLLLLLLLLYYYLLNVTLHCWFYQIRNPTFSFFATVWFSIKKMLYKTTKRTQTVVKRWPKIFLELNSCQTAFKFRKRKNFLDVLLSSTVA